jgi:hypothetical protein
MNGSKAGDSRPDSKANPSIGSPGQDPNGSNPQDPNNSNPPGTKDAPPKNPTSGPISTQPLPKSTEFSEFELSKANNRPPKDAQSPSSIRRINNLSKEVGPYSKSGYNKSGYSKAGYNKAGYNRDGYSKSGYSKSGYSKAGYNEAGYNEAGFNTDGLDTNGLDLDGYDKDGWKYGEDGHQYDRDGYDRNGRDRKGLDKDGYDEDGYRLGGDGQGWDKDGYDRGGRDRKGRSRLENENAKKEGMGGGGKGIHGNNLRFEQGEIENSSDLMKEKNPKPIDESLQVSGVKGLEDDQGLVDVEEVHSPREKKMFEGDELVMKIAEAKAPVEIPDYIKNKMDFEFEEDPAEAALRKKKELDAKKKAEKDAKRKADKEARRIEKAAAAEKKAHEDAVQAKSDQNQKQDSLEAEKTKNAKPDATPEPKFKSSGTDTSPNDLELPLDKKDSEKELSVSPDLTKQQSILKKDTSKAKDLNRRVSFGALEEATP